MVPTGQRVRPPESRLFLEARYRKLVRGLPQTIFYCPRCKGRGCRVCERFGKLTKDSVQELVARKILGWYRARKGKFHGAGREDIDVRMLGQGRPFVFEVLAPRRLDVDLEELRGAINEYGRGRIEVTPFVAVPRPRVAAIKETRSRKVYAALVELGSGAIDAAVRERVAALPGQELTIVQRTPQRVAHRRADKDRTRDVRVRAAFFEPDDRLHVEIECQHGTYVKEWVSGEDGRSQPSLADLLGVETRCLALDVLDVLGPFPPIQSSEGREIAAPTFAAELGWPIAPHLAEDPWGLRPEHREPEPLAGRLASCGDANAAAAANAAADETPSAPEAAAGQREPEDEA